MTAIILAGGKASRMDGVDKAFLKIGKDTLINRQLRLLRRFFKKIIIVTNSPEKYKKIRGAKVISDFLLQRGPLGGIFSGLSVSDDHYNFVVACDMPFINTELIKYMYRQSKGYKVVVPYVDNRYEPLFAIYSKDCLSPIEKLLNDGVFKISKFFSKIKVEKVGASEILKFGQPEELFANINTLQDLKRFNV